MCGVQDWGKDWSRGNEAGAWLLGHLVGVACAEEWIRFFAASPRRAFSRDSITGTIIVHEGPATFHRRNGAIFSRSVDHRPASPDWLTGTLRFSGLTLWTVIGKRIQPRMAMSLRHRSQEIVSVTVSSPVPPPTQGEQTAEQEDQRGDDAPDNRTNGGPVERR
jgi:hypothetical protein